MSAAPIPFVPPRPTYRSPVEFLSAMAMIGATAVLRRADGWIRLDFAVPAEREHRATILIGDRSTWPLELWEEATALAVLLIPGGFAVLDQANDDAHEVDLARLVIGREVEPAAVLRHRLGRAEVGTPRALFAALRAISGEIVLRRDQHGLGLGFAAPDHREVRLDLLLDACASHDGDWWLDAVAELRRMFPNMGSPWTMEPGEAWRLPLAEAGEVAL